MRRIWMVLLPALLLIPSVTASAADGDFYVGASAGTRFSEDFGSSTPGLDVDHAMYKGFAGLTLSERLAVEVAYHSFGDIECCENDFGIVSIREQVDGYSAALVGSLPRGRFELTAKVGVFWWEDTLEYPDLRAADFVPVETKITRDGRDLMAGFGAAYRLGEQWRLRAEYELFDDVPNADAVTAGIQFTF